MKRNIDLSNINEIVVKDKEGQPFMFINFKEKAVILDEHYSAEELKLVEEEHESVDIPSIGRVE